MLHFEGSKSALSLGAVLYKGVFNWLRKFKELLHGRVEVFSLLGSKSVVYNSGESEAAECLTKGLRKGNLVRWTALSPLA
jgi:hypothetical protein